MVVIAAITPEVFTEAVKSAPGIIGLVVLLLFYLVVLFFEGDNRGVRIFVFLVLTVVYSVYIAALIFTNQDSDLQPDQKGSDLTLEEILKELRRK